MAFVEILKAARAKIADPKQWTTGYWAKSASGDKVMPRDPSACPWCALGALYAVGGSSRDEAALWSVGLGQFGGTSPVEINDDLGHEAVLRLFDVAIAKAEGRDA